MEENQPTDVERAKSWRRFCRVFAVTLVCELVVATTVIVAANPYGNLPHLLFKSHVIMDTNQRFQYPAIARSGRYDSIVIGTSTSRLLRPAALEGVFGGRFANLAMDSAMAWEQYRIAKLFAAHTETPRTLLVGIDLVWCAADAYTKRTTYRGFPEWMFDDDPWNDLPRMLNKRTLEISGRRIANALGLNPARIPFDGYEVFVPDESEYDLAKAREYIGQPPAASPVPYIATREERRRWRFPALKWLKTLLDGGWQTAVIAIMPVHVSTQPQPGSKHEAREKECKARLAALAERRGILLVDFRIRSDITTRDENYWDKLHYRVPIAEQLVGHIEHALVTGQDDPEGRWRVLAAARYHIAQQAPSATGSR